METTRRTFLGLTAVTAATIALLPADPVHAAATARPGSPAAPGATRLTNLAHLRFLLADVPVTASGTHTTFGIAARPVVRAPWTYADADGAGGYRRIGGGTRDAATGHWTQGAYNADDIARAAVVSSVTGGRPAMSRVARTPATCCGRSRSCRTRPGRTRDGSSCGSRRTGR